MSTALAILMKIWKFIRPFFASTAESGKTSWADIAKTAAAAIGTYIASLIYTNGTPTFASFVLAAAVALVKYLQARLTPAS